jgi:predicted DNA-binding transcriptional regulator YafY
MLDVIERATEAQTRLLLAYKDVEGRMTGRQVRPLDLFGRGRVWTLVAWCELRDDFRTFRVDRIADAEGAGRFRAEKGRTLRDFYAREAPSHDPT